MKRTESIPNPLPTLRDDFIERKIVGGELRIRPVAPKPDELALFNTAALEAGFRPGPEVLWGDETFPKYYRMPTDPQKQQDWQAVAYFKRQARMREHMGDLEDIADLTHKIGENLYRASVDSGPNWNMTIYRDGVEIETIQL